MKKILIATTAIVAVGFMAAPASASEKIKLNLGGYSTQWIGFTDQDGSYETAKGTDYKALDIQQDSEIYFGGSTKLDNGITVKANIQLEAGRSATGMDDNEVSLSSASMGTLGLGATKSPSFGMRHTAPSSGIGLPDTKNWVVNPGNSSQAREYAFGLNDTYKIYYKSPSFSGLQISADYAPEQTAQNTQAIGTNNDGKASNGGTEFGASMAWNGKMGGGSVGADVAFHAEKGEESGSDHTQTSAGAKFTTGAVTVGGSYTRINAPKSTDITTSIDGNSYSVGVQYKAGAASVSLGYHKGTAEGLTANAVDDKQTSIELGASYALGAGVSLKGAIFQADFDDEAATSSTNTTDNKGWGVVGGIALSF